MNELAYPEPLEKISQLGSGEQGFRWVDTTDTTCMVQLSRKHFRWTPVNLLSHGKYFSKREQAIQFNKHGGIMVGAMLLCWMPGKLYRKWCEMKGKMGISTSAMDKSAKPPGVSTYDPVAEGTATSGAQSYATSEKFTGVVDVMNDTHPDTSYEESGEYT
jgi:hypothetical protein